MATFKTTGRNGALTTYEISGTHAELQSLIAEIADITTYSVDVQNGDLVGQGSKRDISNIRHAVESLKISTPAPAQKSTGNKSGRYIELLETAVANNLNHGKSWACTGTNIDSNSLHPSWEGEQICYVYSD